MEGGRKPSKPRPQAQAATDDDRWIVDVRVVDVALIDEDPENSRLHDKENLEGIGESLAEYGLQKPLVILPVGDRYRVIAGNGTLRQAKALGARRISAAVSTLEGMKAMAYAIADNRTGETSTWDWQKLQAQLGSLRDAGFRMPATGWRPGELGDLHAATFNPPPPPVMPPPGADAGSGDVSAGASSGTPDEDSSDRPDSPPSAEQDQHFDSWCTDAKTLDLVKSVCGLAAFDLDVASNEHSIVPARVALQGGSEPLPEKECRSGPAEPGGRVRVNACGLRNEWPKSAKVWSNNPYDRPAPWVLQAMLHALRGGAGVLLDPCAYLETAWGQAILQARTDLRRAAELLAPHARDCAAADVILAGGKFAKPRAPWRVLIPRGRLSFIDPRQGEVKPRSMLGSMLVFWGFHDLREDAIADDAGTWL